MKILISWSGETSHSVALILHQWLEVVLPYAQLWVSSEDILKGSRWATELASELETTNCGILCITPDNIREPWLNFEAGALSKTVKNAQVHPFLLGFPAKELIGPLSQFQATEFTQNELRKLVFAINSMAKDEAIPKDQLDKKFQICWADINQRITSLLSDLPKTKSKRTPEASNGNESDDADYILSDEETNVLKLFIDANAERLYAPAVAQILKIHLEKARYLLENLEDHRFLYVMHNYVKGPSWTLSSNGRAALVKIGVI